MVFSLPYRDEEELPEYEDLEDWELSNQAFLQWVDENCFEYE